MDGKTGLGCTRCKYLESRGFLKIYPENVIHYSGSISEKDEKFDVDIRVRNQRVYRKLFKTYGDALLTLFGKNIELNLQIKNIIYDLEDHFEVCLTQQKHMKFDGDDIDLVRSYNLHAARHSDTLYYACDSTKQGFQNKVMNFTPEKGLRVVDHINGDGLDNRKVNLRIVDICTQQRNVKTYRNKTGVVGLRFLPKCNTFQGRFKFNKVVYQKSFSVNKYPNARELALEWLVNKKDDLIKPELRTVRSLL